MGFGLMVYDEFCKDCPNRKVGCHNVETCSKWAEHEKKKEQSYHDRQKVYSLSQIEITNWKQKMHRYDHDHRR